MKYDKMIEITQAESQRKMDIAKKTIASMLDNMERITVAELVKRTGLSRGFFYKNQTVRHTLDDAIHKQESILKDQRPGMLDRELEDKMVELRLDLIKTKSKNEELIIQVQELTKINEQLRHEIERLQKQLGRKEVSLLKRL